MIIAILLLAFSIAFCIGIIYSWYALNKADKSEPEPDLSLPISHAYFADKERLERFNAALGNAPRNLYRFEPLEMELEDTFTPDELPQRPRKHDAFENWANSYDWDSFENGEDNDD